MTQSFETGGDARVDAKHIDAHQVMTREIYPTIANSM